MYYITKNNTYIYPHLTQLSYSWDMIPAHLPLCTTPASIIPSNHIMYFFSSVLLLGNNSCLPDFYTYLTTIHCLECTLLQGINNVQIPSSQALRGTQF